MLRYTHHKMILALGMVSVFVLLLISPLLGSSSFADNTYFINLPLLVKSCPSAEVPLSGSWLDYVNFYRSTACLPSVAENNIWSDGDYKHAIYMVKNDVLQHDEDINNPWFTPEGQTAAQQSNLAGNWDINTVDWWAIDTWMQAPFHAIGILDPQLDEVGYGSYREADGELQMAAAINVIAGLSSTSKKNYPVFWPGNGATVPIRFHWGEYPNPLTSCPGYTAPSGLPIIVQIGSGDITPLVSATSFTQDGQILDQCVFDETTYINPDEAQQNLGRSILGARDAVVIIPKSPLSQGMSYTVSITVNEQIYTWSFNISP